MTDQGVFVFTEDGVRFFSSAAMAAAHLETADPADPACDAFIALDGERLVPRQESNARIRLHGTGQRDPGELSALLAHHRDVMGFTSDPRDAAAVANELMARAKAAHWPIALIRRLRSSRARRVTT